MSRVRRTQAETGGLCGDDLPAGGPNGEPKAGKSPSGKFNVNPNHSCRYLGNEQKTVPMHVADKGPMPDWPVCQHQSGQEKSLPCWDEDGGAEFAESD